MSGLTDEVGALVSFYLGTFFALPIALLGCGANVINIAVFHCVSVCLLALTFSDLASVLTGGACFILRMLTHVNVYSVIQPKAFIFIMGYACAMFYDISQAVMAFIAVERCICVAMPLKFKNLIPFRRAVMVVFAIYFFTALAHLPHYLTSCLVKQWDPTVNRTRLFVWYAEYRPVVDLYLSTFLHIIMSTLYQVIILVSTYVMVRGLKLSAQFRKRQEDVGHSQNESPTTGKKDMNSQSKKVTKTNYKRDAGAMIGDKCPLRSKSNQEQGQGLSQKNVKVVKTVTALAMISLICNAVRLINVYCSRFIPGLNYIGVYRNEFEVMNIATFVFQTVNTSANIVVYYSMNSSFRTTLKIIFCGSKHAMDTISK